VVKSLASDVATWHAVNATKASVLKAAWMALGSETSESKMEYAADENEEPWSDDRTVSTLEDGYAGDRIFSSVYDLIRKCGCRLMLKGNPHTEGFGHIGSSPSGTAQLCLTGIVTVRSRSLADLAWAAHEAVHFLCGDASFEDEIGMMALEWLLYNGVQKKRDRHELILNLSGTGLAGCEMRDLVYEYGGFDFFLGEEWKGIMRDAQQLSYVDENRDIHPDILHRFRD